MGKERVEVEWTTIAYAYDSFVENFEGELGQDAEHLFYRGVITALLHVQLALDKVDFNAIDDWIDEAHGFYIDKVANYPDLMAKYDEYRRQIKGGIDDDEDVVL